MPFLPHTQIEIVNPSFCRGRVRFALFDFDGTLSLVRQGWQGVMVPMMVEILATLDTGEPEPSLTRVVGEFVDRLTGKQTIYQMMELCRQIELRGGTARDPLVYKHQYLDRLWQHIEGRVEGLKGGQIAPADMVVPDAFAVLDNLRQRGILCYLASGTDQPDVIDEARALGLEPYFEDRIFGALDEYKRFSKAQVIQNILDGTRLTAGQLLTFGDGFVEIEETRKVGGIAVGVASDELHRRGVDEWKRERLIRAGADVIIPDFRKQDLLLDELCSPTGRKTDALSDL